MEISEIDSLKRDVLKQHVDDLKASGAIQTNDFVARGYLTPDGMESTPLGDEFLTLHEKGLMDNKGNVTDQGQTYLMSKRDSLDAPIEVYKEREQKGLNAAESADAPESGGFWSMIGDFTAKGVPRMVETAYNAEQPLLDKLLTIPRKIYQGVTGDEIHLPRTKTNDEVVNSIAETVTGGVLASEPLASGAKEWFDRGIAAAKGKEDEYWKARQAADLHRAEIGEINGAQMMDTLTGIDQWQKSRAALVDQHGEDAVKKDENFDRLAGQFILDPNNILSAGIGAGIEKGMAAAGRATLWAEKTAMTMKGLQLEHAGVVAERAIKESAIIKAQSVADGVAERAAAFRGVGNEAQALRYEATAARVNEKIAGITPDVESLAAKEAELAGDIEGLSKQAGVAEKLNGFNAKVAAIRQAPAKVFGEITERVGTGLVKTDEFLANAAEKAGFSGAYKSLHSLPFRAGAIASSTVMGPIAGITGAASQIMASGPLLQSIGNFSKVLGRELIAERGTVPFWRRVANNSTISKTQRFLAHRADEMTLGGRLTEVTTPALRGAVKSYPMNLAFEMAQNPNEDIGTAMQNAVGPSLVFGGGFAGAGAMFQGDKARMKSMRINDEINFSRTLLDSQKQGFSGMNRGARRVISTYAGAFPNLNWEFKPDGPSHYDPVTNTVRINPTSNNPLRALVGHEVLHYVTIRNQMQYVIHSMLLGDNVTPGLLRHTDGTITPEFQKFKNEYELRREKAKLEKPTIEESAEEFFNENTVDHLMEMVESGEFSKMAGRTQTGRHMRAFIESTIPRIPILRDFFFRTGGVMEAGGRMVMGNGLLSEKIRELPEARAMMRKMVRDSAGEAAYSNKLAKSKDGAGSPITVQKGDPIIDSFHAILESDANGNPIKDKNGDHIALSRATDEARSSAGHVITETMVNKVNKGYLPAKGEIAALDSGGWFGEHIPKEAIDALSTKGILNSKQIAILRNINTATETGQGHRFLLTNHPATIKGRGGKVKYATLGATLRETVPVGIGVTEKGNILVHLMNVEQFNRNITNRAASKTGKRLYDGNTEVIKQDAAAMMDAHAANTKTDKFYQDKYGPAWKDHQNFINTLFGEMTKAQRDYNPMLQADAVGSNQNVYRTYRLDRISKATKMDGTPIPFGYSHVKVNFLPDGVHEAAKSPEPLDTQARVEGMKDDYKGADEGPNYQIEHKPMSVEGGAAPLNAADNSFGPDIYTKNAMQYFGTGDPIERASLRVINQVRGNPNAKVTIYRGVPDGVTKINPGDWVAITKEGAGIYGNILSKEVNASEITTWPDSLAEFGYFPQTP